MLFNNPLLLSRRREVVSAPAAFNPVTDGYHYWDFENPYSDNGATLITTQGVLVQQVSDLCVAGNHFRQATPANQPIFYKDDEDGGVATEQGSYFGVGDGGAGHGAYMDTINNISINAPFFIACVWAQFYGGIPAYSVMLGDPDIIIFARHAGLADKMAIYSTTNTTEIRAGTGGLTDASLYHFYAEVNGASSTAKLGGATGSAETGGDLGVANFNNTNALRVGYDVIGNTLNSVLMRIYIGPLATKSDWNTYAVATWGVTI